MKTLNPSLFLFLFAGNAMAMEPGIDARIYQKTKCTVTLNFALGF